jgi:hypothetical protein
MFHYIFNEKEIENIQMNGNVPDLNKSLQGVFAHYKKIKKQQE